MGSRDYWQCIHVSQGGSGILDLTNQIEPRRDPAALYFIRTAGGCMTDEHRLSDLLSEFAHTLVTDFPIQGILDHLVVRIVDVLPITAAGVTIISPGVAPRFLAASNDSAMQFERLQTELGEGPCLAAYETGHAVAIA